MPHADTEDQLVEQPAIRLFAELEAFLAKAQGHAGSAKEPTLFSVGGRGYYENPTSDLLAFFLKPTAEHGLGALFLESFLECIGVGRGELDLNQVKIDREVRTENQNRIDIQIVATNWCLLIENKIYHWQANPFSDYERYAADLDKKKMLFAILSPDGKSEAEGWVGVAYSDYCRALRHKLPQFASTDFRSKWQIFAREFVLHLENELYLPPMTREQVTFVENHAPQITAVRDLATQYSLFIGQELKRRLEMTLQGFIFDVLAISWPSHWLTMRCTCQSLGDTEMVLYKLEGMGQKHFVRVYLKGLSERQQPTVEDAFKQMDGPVKEGQYEYWSSRRGSDSSEEAITEMCKLAATVSDLLKK